MNTLIIRKKSLKTWLHTDSILGDFIISKFYFNSTNLTFQIVEQGQSKRIIYNISDITLYNTIDGGGAETFATISELSLRLEELNYPAFQYDGQITSIANLIEEGTNITITGDGTLLSPYVINATGGAGGTPTLQEVLDEGDNATINGTGDLSIVYVDGTLSSEIYQDKNVASLTSYNADGNISLVADTDTNIFLRKNLASTNLKISVENPTGVDGIIVIKDPVSEIETVAFLSDITGGGSQTLAETLVNGNTTEGLNISISDGDAVALDNTSKLKKGTTNAGNGGNNGIALKCSLDYEFKWEAGRMYIMEQDGIGIRETRYNFNIAPSATDDSTKGYAVNSRWILDNGTMYECTDATSGNAIWENITVNVAPERLAKINASSVLGDGFNFHTFFSVGGALFGGERAGASVAPRFYKFSDPNDLSVSEFISMTFVGAGVNGFESMCYDANTDNFYGMLSNTTKIIRINATDITDYTISDISGHINFPVGCSFSGSGGICTDETHLYIGTEQIPNSFVLKVLISDLSVVDSYEWARPSIHAANINVTNGYCVFTTNGSDCYLLKVDLSDLSNVELQLNIDGLTDDFALASDFDWAFCGGEANIGASVGGVGIDLTTMTAYPMNCLPSTGFFYDAANSLVINTSLLGFVETYDIFNLIDAVSTGLPSQIDVVKTYTMRGFWVNEWAKVGSDYFVTTWENNTSGLIKKIELIEFKNPLITKEEVKSRFNQSGGGSAWGDITGTLSAQTDLQSALNAKEPTISVGTTSQYWRGDKTWQTFPTNPSSGGASVSYYLNGSVSQGTIGGAAYKEMNGTPVIGAGTDFTINADGYITQFITDVGDPNKLLIPGGNWNFETYFSASSSGGTPRFYIELYKYDGATFTLISSNSATPENITGGTSVDLYFTALAVPPTTLLATDRLAVRFYVIHSGRTITMHTENSHLSQIITTFSTGLTSLNGLSLSTQYFAVGTVGTDFAISSVSDTHTFNLPTASASNRGLLSSANWSTFNDKQNALGFTAENVANKSTDVNTDQASSTKYPTVKSVYDWAIGLFATTAQVNLRTRELLQDFTDYTTTGVLTEQIISNQAITANDMKINSWLNFIATLSRTGTTNATVSIYLSTTSNSIAGAVKIGTATMTSTQSLPCFKRDFSINASSVLRGILFTGNIVTDEIVTQAQSTTTLTLGSAYYLITTVALNNTADTVTQRAINLKSSK